MRKIKYVWEIVKDRWLSPYDDIVVRFNTKAKKDSDLIWRVFVNGNEMLASGFEIHGFVQDVCTIENGITKYNVGCKGRVRWQKTKAIIYTAKKQNEDVFL